jgi:hypothetical protein
MVGSDRDYVISVNLNVWLDSPDPFDGFRRRQGDSLPKATGIPHTPAMTTMP